ncbi:hypothetical protein BDK51DRAFT_45113, partial [Blyttiomyces helicus]
WARSAANARSLTGRDDKKREFQTAKLETQCRKELVLFLGGHRAERCSTDAMRYACRYRCIELERFLLAKRPEYADAEAARIAFTFADAEILRTLYKAGIRLEDAEAAELLSGTDVSFETEVSRRESASATSNCVLANVATLNLPNQLGHLDPIIARAMSSVSSTGASGQLVLESALEWRGCWLWGGVLEVGQRPTSDSWCFGNRPETIQGLNRTHLDHETLSTRAPSTPLCVASNASYRGQIRIDPRHHHPPRDKEGFKLAACSVV